MSPALSADTPRAARDARSAGVWSAAWQRFRTDRVGMAGLGVVLAFLLMIAASALGLLAGDWQRERGLLRVTAGLAGGSSILAPLSFCSSAHCAPSACHSCSIIRGRRWITTFKKLPISKPRTPPAAAFNAISEIIRPLDPA